MIIILVNSFKSTDTLITIFTIILIIQREIIHCLFQNDAFSLYDHIWPHPITGTPAPGVMKFTILVEASLLIITIYSVCLLDAQD